MAMMVTTCIVSTLVMPSFSCVTQPQSSKHDKYNPGVEIQGASGPMLIVEQGPFVPLSCDTTLTPSPHPNKWQQLQSTADVSAQPPAVGVTNHDSTGT
ncbi:hypothetical protein JB92DRAFT_2865735 [Gautieria morchelliformis]|nr:hypothetical protein JB92DRAFT_2865735 [Gautieria morchelliformis]